MSYKKLWGHRTPLGAASRFCRLPRSLAEEEKEETAAAAASLSCLSICYLPPSDGDAALLAGYPKVKFSDGIFRFRPNAGVECQRGGGRGRIEFSGPTTQRASSMADGDIHLGRSGTEAERI